MPIGGLGAIAVRLLSVPMKLIKNLLEINWNHLGTTCKSASRKIGNYIFSIFGAIFLPLLPLTIEWLQKGSILNKNIAIAASILAVSFAIISEHNLYRAIYLFVFIVALILHTLIISGPIYSGADDYAVHLLGAATLPHIVERLWWHIVLDRPFPDSLRSSQR